MNITNQIEPTQGVTAPRNVTGRKPVVSPESNPKQILLTRRSPTYWRVTFNLPPVNFFGPTNIPQLNEVITALETDKDVKVVVFDSAVEGFFLTHYNFLAPLETNLLSR